MTPFECPHCGGTDVVYMEDISTWRRLLGVDELGSLNVAVASTYHANDENPVRERLHCNGCDKDVRLPDKLDFVWG